MYSHDHLPLTQRHLPIPFSKQGLADMEDIVGAGRSHSQYPRARPPGDIRKGGIGWSAWSISLHGLLAALSPWRSLSLSPRLLVGALRVFISARRRR